MCESRLKILEEKKHFITMLVEQPNILPRDCNYMGINGSFVCLFFWDMFVITKLLFFCSSISGGKWQELQQVNSSIPPVNTSSIPVARVLRKSSESHQKVLRKSSESPPKVFRQSPESPKKVFRKSSESPQKVLRKSLVSLQNSWLFAHP